MWVGVFPGALPLAMVAARLWRQVFGESRPKVYRSVLISGMTRKRWPVLHCCMLARGTPERIGR